MKHLTAVVAVAAVSLALAGCGSKTETKTSTSTSSTTSSTSTTSASSTSATPGAQAKKTISDYLNENHITETPVHLGDPGSPTINLPMPNGWQTANDSSTSYGAIVYSQPADPKDPPTISALVSKLTGNVDPAKIIEYAPANCRTCPDTRVRATGPRPRSAVSMPGSWAAPTCGTARHAPSPRRRW
ncbi:putative lipoLpqN family protein [Mycobacterium kansasii 732]|nr:putative lipoLpqN family protein [Mycobacterium kansasii 732]